MQRVNLRHQCKQHVTPICCVQLVVSVIMRPRGCSAASLGPPPVKNVRINGTHGERRETKKNPPAAYFHATFCRRVNKSRLNSYTADLIPHVFVDLPLRMKISQSESALLGVTFSFLFFFQRGSTPVGWIVTLKQGLKPSQSSAWLSVPIQSELRRNTLDICPSN